MFPFVPGTHAWALSCVTAPPAASTSATTAVSRNVLSLMGSTSDVDVDALRRGTADQCVARSRLHGVPDSVAGEHGVDQPVRAPGVDSQPATVPCRDPP